MKILARVISVVAILLGGFLVSRTYILESRYAATMPRGRDITQGRTISVVVSHETSVYVSEAEAKTLDTAQTYFTFGWPFVILGVLLAAASRERRPPFAPPNESDSPWAERR